MEKEKWSYNDVLTEAKKKKNFFTIGNGPSNDIYELHGIEEIKLPISKSISQYRGYRESKIWYHKINETNMHEGILTNNGNPSPLGVKKNDMYAYLGTKIIFKLDKQEEERIETEKNLTRRHEMFEEYNEAKNKLRILERTRDEKVKEKKEASTTEQKFKDLEYLIIRLNNEIFSMEDKKERLGDELKKFNKNLQKLSPEKYYLPERYEDRERRLRLEEYIRNRTEEQKQADEIAIQDRIAEAEAEAEAEAKANRHTTLEENQSLRLPTSISDTKGGYRRRKSKKKNIRKGKQKSSRR